MGRILLSDTHSGEADFALALYCIRPREYWQFFPEGLKVACIC